MLYDIRKMTVDQLAEEVQSVLADSEDHSGWMTLKEIISALDLEGDPYALKSVKVALGWMADRGMIQKSAVIRPTLYRLLVAY